MRYTIHTREVREKPPYNTSKILVKPLIGMPYTISLTEPLYTSNQYIPNIVHVDCKHA